MQGDHMQVYYTKECTQFLEKIGTPTDALNVLAGVVLNEPRREGAMTDGAEFAGADGVVLAAMRDWSCDEGYIMSQAHYIALKKALQEEYVPDRKWQQVVRYAKKMLGSDAVIVRV